MEFFVGAAILVHYSAAVAQREDRGDWNAIFAGQPDLDARVAIVNHKSCGRVAHWLLMPRIVGLKLPLLEPGGGFYLGWWPGVVAVAFVNGSL